jgi:hypothetical protein
MLSPVGYLVAGFVLDDHGVTALFTGVALVQTLAMVLCAATVLRERQRPHRARGMAYRFRDGV